MKVAWPFASVVTVAAKSCRRLRDPSPKSTEMVLPARGGMPGESDLRVTRKVALSVATPLAGVAVSFRVDG